jgi:hypothetical protein
MFVAAAPAPYLTSALNPPNPRIVSSAPLGSYVAKIVASWSNGAPFTGTFAFGRPYSNDAGMFAISGNNLIINPNGPGGSFGQEHTSECHDHRHAMRTGECAADPRPLCFSSPGS